MALQDYSTDPDQNDLVLGIDIGEECPADNINNSIRKLCADLASWVSSAIFTGITKIRDVAGDTGNAILRFTNNAGSTTLGFVQGLAGGGLALGGATERIRITAAGNVGIGTTAPGLPLTVNGEIRGSAFSFPINGVYWGADNGRSVIYGDSADFYSYDRVNNLHEFWIGNDRKGYVDGAGRIVAQTEVVAGTLIRAGGFTNFFMNYNGGSPYLNFDNGDYIGLDPANNHFNFVLNNVNQMAAGINGLIMAGAGGGFKGAGTINAAGLYQNGQSVAAIAAQSLGNPGYMVLSNGFRIMWGTGTVGGNVSVNVNYPTAFSSFSIPVLSGGININNADENYAAVIQGSSSTTGFSVINSYSSGHSFYWIAVGI